MSSDAVLISFLRVECEQIPILASLFLSYIFPSVFVLFQNFMTSLTSQNSILGFVGRLNFVVYGKGPKISNTLFHIFWPKFCFVCGCFLKYFIEWKRV